jgi:hypothetical protein
MPWDEFDIRPGFSYQAMKTGQFKTLHGFGGQLTENAVMGIERDLMTNAMLKCNRNGLPIVLEVHDEILAEPLRRPDNKQILEQIMVDIPDWAKTMRIPISVDMWTGSTYRK